MPEKSPFHKCRATFMYVLHFYVNRDDVRMHIIRTRALAYLVFIIVLYRNLLICIFFRRYFNLAKPQEFIHVTMLPLQWWSHTFCRCKTCIIYAFVFKAYLQRIKTRFLMRVSVVRRQLGSLHHAQHVIFRKKKMYKN